MATTKTAAKKTTSASAAKTAGAKAAVKKPAAAKKPAAKRAKADVAKGAVTPEQRYRMIAEAAYYRAERQGFMGDPVQDWIEAEAEINAHLSGGK